LRRFFRSRPVSAKLDKLDPPSDAKAANTALAQAFADNARVVRGVLGQLGSAKGS